MIVTFCTGAARCCVHAVSSIHAQRREFDDKPRVLISRARSQVHSRRQGRSP